METLFYQQETAGIWPSSVVYFWSAYHLARWYNGLAISGMAISLAGVYKTKHNSWSMFEVALLCDMNLILQFETIKMGGRLHP